MMNLLHAIVLGIVQGLTEFLPISSTAHLRIVPAFLGWGDPGAAFTAVVQLGTMAAVLIFFRDELLNIARATIASLQDRSLWHTRDRAAREGWYIVLGTIPIAILGVLFKHRIEHQFRSLELIGTALIVMGLVMLWFDATSRRERTLDDLTMRDGWIVGFAQAAALIPGVSRSGATISAGLGLGFDRVSAARYSFLLSVPAVVLSGLFELKDVGNGGGYGPFPTIVATIVAFFVGYWSIAFLLRYLTSHTLKPFIAYRLVVGALVLILAANNTIT
jgi:undecaprenyl-diphosphatase